MGSSRARKSYPFQERMKAMGSPWRLRVRNIPHIDVVETIAGGTGRRLELFVECAIVRALIAAPGEPAH